MHKIKNVLKSEAISAVPKRNRNKAATPDGIIIETVSSLDDIAINQLTVIYDKKFQKNSLDLSS